MSLWYKESGPEHLRHYLADQTVLWANSDTEELYLKNRQDPDRSRRLDELGHSHDSITYSYNHQGFRCEQFDGRPAGLAIGCSITEGVGVREEHTWPSVLSRMLHTHIWNLGIGGQGSASNFRILLHYLPVLKPKFVVHCISSRFRFEFRDEYQRKISVTASTEFSDLTNGFFKTWFAHDDNSELYSLAHEMATRHLCRDLDIPYFALYTEKDIEWDMSARDLTHPGPGALEKIALKMKNLIDKG
jgi:hypothetical protein